MSEKDKLLQYLNDLVQPRDPNETKEWYTKWASNYEKDMVFMEYNGPELAVTGFLELHLPKDINILDIGSGTGQTGAFLQKNGYTNIDALDATQEMLEIVKQKKCYKNLINCVVTKDTRLPIDDKTYDAVFMVGCLCPGHIRWNSFPQIIRVIKQGGVLIWTMGASQAFEDDEDFQYKNSEKLIESLCEQRKWDYLPGFPKKVENYLTGKDGNIYAMKVL